MKFPQIGRHAHGDVVRHFADELGAKPVLAHRRLEWAVLVGRLVGPPSFDHGVFGTEDVLVDITVLDDERGDPIRMRDRVPESYLRAIIMQPQGVALETECINKFGKHVGIGVKIIAEGGQIGCAAVPEARPVECNRPPAVGERGHQLAELV
ncbi:hypothetical protein X743_29030 [Mesorhizobium sp. LNHC252B00]|nr:hypothetical protein X743_29030 [Mesorhizobium sp. LNHC252B00]